jgi:hypothetical protein
VNAEARGTDRPLARLMVIDRREALLFPVPEPGIRRMDEIVVWTDNRDFVAAQTAYFEAIWQHSQPFGLPRSARTPVRS